MSKSHDLIGQTVPSRFRYSIPCSSTDVRNLEPLLWYSDVRIQQVAYRLSPQEVLEVKLKKTFSISSDQEG